MLMPVNVYSIWAVQIHGKGLKFGIYGDFGTHTCGGYPGNEYYLQYDAETYANWTVDYLKLDGCNSDISQYDDGKLLQLFVIAHFVYFYQTVLKINVTCLLVVCSNLALVPR